MMSLYSTSLQLLTWYMACIRLPVNTVRITQGSSFSKKLYNHMFRLNSRSLPSKSSNYKQKIAKN